MFILSKHRENSISIRNMFSGAERLRTERYAQIYKDSVCNMSRHVRDSLSPAGKIHNWQEHEITELLAIRASEGIRHLITGTVKDGVVYSRVSKMLAERGVYRTQMQVISKLKSLKKQYATYHQQKIRSRGDRVNWPFYEQCHRAFGNPSPMGNAVQRHRSPTPPSAPSPPPPPAISEKHQEVVVSLWDEVDDNKHLGPVDADDEEEQYSPPEQLHTIKTSKYLNKNKSMYPDSYTT